MNFESFNLDPRIMKAIADSGYTSPTPIQQQAIPMVAEGHDLMGIAQTGTGKTAAFALPLLQKLTTGPTRRTRILVIAPTRELAEQIADEFARFANGLKIRVATIYGGVGMNPQINALRNGAEVIVACPGRLLDHLERGTADLRDVEALVIDEADQLFDMGFLPNLRKIVRALPAQRQTLMFSATMPDDIRRLAREILSEPKFVQVDRIAPAATVTQALYPVAQKMKTTLLKEMLKTINTGSVLVFTRTKHRAKSLDKQLHLAGHRVASIQGNLSQAKRQEAMDGFKNGTYRVLVATDIAARGIDVSRVSHVINFDVPETPEAYTHRIGRTGRAERTGDAFTFVAPEDSEKVRQIERLLGQKIDRKTLEGFDYNQKVESGEFARDASDRDWPSQRRDGGPRRGGGAPSHNSGGGRGGGAPRGGNAPRSNSSSPRADGGHGDGGNDRGDRPRTIPHPLQRHQRGRANSGGNGGGYRPDNGPRNDNRGPQQSDNRNASGPRDDRRPSNNQPRGASGPSKRPHRDGPREAWGPARNDNRGNAPQGGNRNDAPRPSSNNDTSEGRAALQRLMNAGRSARADRNDRGPRTAD